MRVHSCERFHVCAHGCMRARGYVSARMHEQVRRGALRCAQRRAEARAKASRGAEACAKASRGADRRSEARIGAQRRAVAGRGAQRRSETPRGTQRRAEARRGTQRRAEALRGAQRRAYRKVASRAYKHISRFLHQASMQTRLVCKPCLYAPLIFLPGLYAHRPIRACIETSLLRGIRATRVDLPLTTGMAAVLLCTVHSACTLDLPDPRLH